MLKSERHSPVYKTSGKCLRLAITKTSTRLDRDEHNENNNDNTRIYYTLQISVRRHLKTARYQLFKMKTSIGTVKCLDLQSSKLRTMGHTGAVQYAETFTFRLFLIDVPCTSFSILQLLKSMTMYIAVTITIG